MPNSSSPPSPLLFAPRQGAPKQLFVLLHGESAGPRQLFRFADAIKKHFPQSLIFLPYGLFQSSLSAESDGTTEATAPTDGEPSGSQSSFEASLPQGTLAEASAAYHWIDPAGLSAQNRIQRLHHALFPLLAQIHHIQQQFGLSGQQTALAGFSQGASLALEALRIQPSLAGRVLAFSGGYADELDEAPPATLLHFFHGENDTQVSVDDMRATLARLAELQGDATLDMASQVGHEMHPALIEQAIVRLQTCVPLRSWEAALNSLESGNDSMPQPTEGSPQACPLTPSQRRTLH